MRFSRVVDPTGQSAQTQEPLDLRHYAAVGAMQQALSLHAEEAFVELGTDAAREDAEKVFKCITEKGQDGRGIRRPSSVEEICAVTDAPLGDLFLPADVVPLADQSPAKKDAPLVDTTTPDTYIVPDTRPPDTSPPRNRPAPQLSGR